MWALPPFRRWLLTCHDRVGDERLATVRPHTSPSALLTGARLGGDFNVFALCHFIKLCLLGCTLIVSNYCFFHTVGFTLISASMPFAGPPLSLRCAQRCARCSEPLSGLTSWDWRIGLSMELENWSPTLCSQEAFTGVTNKVW